jgi:saccharopine dehydrogenase (NADP+, L-glutamate forming)
MQLYKLEGIRTLFRGTLRRPGFCKGWDSLVQLGATDDSYQLEKVGELTHRQFINTFLPYNPTDSVELKLAYYLGIELESEEMFKLKWLGLFEEEPVGLEEGTPAQILEHILMKKWKLEPEEKDMIVMWHKFNYLENGQAREVHAQMVVKGTDQEDTAMSKTVGLPLAMATKLLLNGQMRLSGVHIPTEASIYDPVLTELGEEGFAFSEHPVR